MLKAIASIAPVAGSADVAKSFCCYFAFENSNEAFGRFVGVENCGCWCRTARLHVSDLMANAFAVSHRIGGRHAIGVVVVVHGGPQEWLEIGCKGAPCWLDDGRDRASEVIGRITSRTGITGARQESNSENHTVKFWPCQGMATLLRTGL